VAKKKQRRNDPARSRPLTLEFLRDLGTLKDFVPPTGPFEPNGTWTTSYRLWLVQRHFGGGALTIRREPTDGGIRLTVDLAVAEYAGYLRRTRTVVECASDTLCTPKSWTLESSVVDVDDKPSTGTRLAERGTLRGEVLETRFGDRVRKQKLAAPATCNWSLFDAVQRLPREKTRPLAFTLLEDMDLVKPEQTLTFRETKDLKLGAATLRLTGYQQIGRGVLPWQYWVDGQGRLLFAFSGVRAYLYDPKPTEWMRKKLDSARTRIKRRRKAK